MKNKKIIFTILCVVFFSIPNTNAQIKKSKGKQKLDCNCHIKVLMNDKSSDCIEIKNAIIEFNLKAYDAVQTNEFFASDIASYFTKPPYNMEPSDIISMIENLKTSFENTGSILKMLKIRYQNYPDGLSPEFHVLHLGVKNCEILTKYTLNNL